MNIVTSKGVVPGFNVSAGFQRMMIPQEGLDFLGQLPEEISERLLNGFVRASEWERVTEHFKQSSYFANILMKDPGTFWMLEKVYNKERVVGIIDNFLFNTISGKALYNRLEAVVSVATKEIKEIVARQGIARILNLGSGPGRDTIEILRRNPCLKKSVFVTCADINPQALKKGRELAEKYGLSKNFQFIEKDLLKLRYRTDYKSRFDLGLMVGVLCGFEHRICLLVLKKVKRYFRKGGLLIASNVLDTMLANDAFMAYILKEIIGWKLVYKTPFELRQIFEEAGYEWEDCFFDEPANFHCMGIGRVPFS